MRKKFSKSWKGSKQKRKQRKYRYNAPLNIRHKLITANLTKELRKKYRRRSFPLRKGDSIRVMLGEFKGKKGKVSRVNLYSIKVYVEGLQKTKKDGTKVNIPFQPSNLQIIEFDLGDKKRIKALEKGKKEEKQENKIKNEKIKQEKK